MKSVSVEFMQRHFKINSDYWIENECVMQELQDYHSSYKDKVRAASIDDVLSLATIHAIYRGKSIMECLPARYQDALLALDKKII